MYFYFTMIIYRMQNWRSESYARAWITCTFCHPHGWTSVQCEIPNRSSKYITLLLQVNFSSRHELFTRNVYHDLFVCSRNVLQKARELGLRTIALPVINSVRRNYPPDAGAHIALSKNMNSVIVLTV